ncbi:MAG TPA: hypothetical protein VMX75_00435 [Spirochaetia bacterium]|nr:hypothetical protein [Spirochaetia bacterium]
MSAPFLRYVKSRFSLGRALTFLPLLFLDHLYCSAGVFCALLTHPFRKKRDRQGAC